MSTAVQPYTAPKTVTLSLPNNMGDLIVRPLSSETITLASNALLIEPNLYQISGMMVKHQKSWYFLNKLEIGQPGGRPSPKKQEAVAAIIGGFLNVQLETNPEFKATLEELRKAEEIRRAAYERNRTQSEYTSLQHRVERAMVLVQERRIRLAEAEQDYQKERQALMEFEVDHPELVAPQNLVEVVP